MNNKNVLKNICKIFNIIVSVLFFSCMETKTQNHCGCDENGWKVIGFGICNVLVNTDYYKDDIYYIPEKIGDSTFISVYMVDRNFSPLNICPLLAPNDLFIKLDDSFVVLKGDTIPLIYPSLIDSSDLNVKEYRLSKAFAEVNNKLLESLTDSMKVFKDNKELPICSEVIYTTTVYWPVK